MRRLWTLIIILFSHSIYAENLLDVYQDAVMHDKTLQQAHYSSQVAAEGIPISVAELLPSLSVNGFTTANRNNVIKAPGFSPVTSTLHYNSHAYSISINQPLFDLPAWLAVREARASAKQALSHYAAAQQDLVTRTTKAYFNVLFAQDNLRFIRAEKRATAKHLEQSREQHEVGLKTITDVYAAQADYDIIVAAEIAAKNDIRNAKERLAVITGKIYDHLAPLRKRIPLPMPQPRVAQRWVQIALKQNRELIAANYSTQAAKEQVHQAFSGHFPLIKAAGAVEHADNGNASGVGTSKNALTSLSLQAELPLFNGFGVVTSTRQARFAYQEALAARDQIQRETVADTRQIFNDIVSGISKTKADRRTIKSTHSALQSINAEFEVGTRTMVDVLDAQKDLYNAQRQTSQDQYDFLNNSLALKQSAGILCAGDLKYINNLLISDQRNPLPSLRGTPSPSL